MVTQLEREFAEPPPPPSARHGHDDFRLAFTETHAEIMAVDQTEITQINLDIEAAVSTALIVEARLHRHMENIELLPTFNARFARDLKRYAMALWYCTGLYQQAKNPAEDPAHLQPELAKIRQRLIMNAKVLVAEGLLDSRFEDELTGEVGYLNTASDVRNIVLKLRLNFDKIEARTNITNRDLDHALNMAEKMSFSYGAQQNQQMSEVKAADLRARAFALFTRAYDQVRRAILFLRWDANDGDEVVPSLFIKSATKKDVANEPTLPANGGVTTAPTGTSATPSPAAGTTVASAAPAGTAASPTAASPAAAGTVLTTTSSVNNGTLSVQTSAAPGMPGHEPFTS